MTWKFSPPQLTQQAAIPVLPCRGVSSSQGSIFRDLLTKDQLRLGRALFGAIDVGHTVTELFRGLIDLRGNARGRIDGCQRLASFTDEVRHALLLDDFGSCRKIWWPPRDLAAVAHGFQTRLLYLLCPEDCSC